MVAWNEEVDPVVIFKLSRGAQQKLRGGGPPRAHSDLLPIGFCKGSPWSASSSSSDVSLEKDLPVRAPAQPQLCSEGGSRHIHAGRGKAPLNLWVGSHKSQRQRRALGTGAWSGSGTPPAACSRLCCCGVSSPCPGENYPPPICPPPEARPMLGPE